MPTVFLLGLCQLIGLWRDRNTWHNVTLMPVENYFHLSFRAERLPA